MSRTGIVSADCTIELAGPRSIVRIDFDIRRHRFLADHLVDSQPLLSTVMGIEAMACAAAVLEPDLVIGAVTALRVGPPFLLPATGTGHVEVVLSGATQRYELMSTSVRDGTTTVHFTAELSAAARGTPAATRVQPDAAGAGVVGSAAIYSLFFHGDSFRVVDWAQFANDQMRGRLAANLPPITTPPRPSITAPLLIELCLQTAGLWELAAFNRMAIPCGIDQITRVTDHDVGSPGRLTAIVTPRLDGANTSVFDAVVIDDDGAPHLKVDGYRTTLFGHSYDTAAAARIRTALTPVPVDPAFLRLLGK